MKKQLLTCSSILLCLGTAYGQPQKGRSLLGAHFNGGSTTSENYYMPATSTPVASQNKSSNFSIGHSLDYFLSDKVSIGEDQSYGISKIISKDLNNDSTNHERRTIHYRSSLNITRYFAIKGPLYLGLKNGIYGTFSSGEEPDNLYRKDFEDINKSIGYTLNLGLNYFVTNRLVLNTYINILNVYYNRSKSSQKVREQNVSGNYEYTEKSSKTQSLGLGGINTFNLTNITVGIQYYFGKKTETEIVK